MALGEEGNPVISEAINYATNSSTEENILDSVAEVDHAIQTQSLEQATGVSGDGPAENYIQGQSQDHTLVNRPAQNHIPSPHMDPTESPPDFLKAIFKDPQWVEELDPYFFSESVNTTPPKWSSSNASDPTLLKNEILVNFLNSSLSEETAPDSHPQGLTTLDLDVMSAARIHMSEIIPGKLPVSMIYLLERAS
jgi:hypothetical protein